MEHTLPNMEDILNHAVSGFHQYILTAPVHLCYASQSLCAMTGFEASELCSEHSDGYAALVHPADRTRYDELLRTASAGQVGTADYRLLKKDGTMLHVRDILTPQWLPDGQLTGCSVLTEIGDILSENNNLQFLNETMPCGFLKYTCEAQPKVTYINRQMTELLRFPTAQEGDPNQLELCKNNIFLMIPLEERQRFSRYLERVRTAGTPLAGEMTVLRCDGTRAHLFGWVTKCVNAQGVEEFQSVCMDVTERHEAKKATEAQRYLKALTDVYDKIFEFDLSSNTVKCLYSNNSPMFKWLEQISMQIGDATERWIKGTVAPEDRPWIRAFFQDFCQKRLYQPGGRPPQITYRARSSSGEPHLYRGIFLKLDESVSLYCCRRVPDREEAELLRSENVHLRENMQELVARFTDGVAAFEVTPEDWVIPLYASDNVCGFFGYSTLEWRDLMGKRTPLKTFVAHSDTAYDDFAALLQTGKAEFTYFDLKTETEQRIRAVCSQKQPGSTASRYVMLYKVDAADRTAALPENRAVSIRTFGYFDVFVGDKPIAFRNKKAKELFALLVDRRGGYISSEEAISFLWEDEPANTVTLARYRKVALRLKNTLEEYGIPDVVETVDGKRRIVPEKLQCDLYDYLAGRDDQLFKGSYLTNYSWAERTLGELSNQQPDP